MEMPTLNRTRGPVRTAAPPEALHIGRLIAQRLDELGMTRAELGRRIGTSRQNVNSLLNKRLPAIDHIWQASAILHCDFFATLSGGLRAAEPRCVPADDTRADMPPEARLLAAMLRAALDAVERGGP
jgi:transcriptional regulator with XRE-family HTH domain